MGTQVSSQCFCPRRTRSNTVTAGLYQNRPISDAAFKVLKESLDPSIDPFEAANRFRCMTWPSGELVYNFFCEIPGSGSEGQVER